MNAGVRRLFGKGLEYASNNGVFPPNYVRVFDAFSAKL